MNNFLTWLTDVNNVINSFVWGKGLYLLLATGLLMTVLTKVFQVTPIGHWFSQTLGSIFKKDVSGHVQGKSISQFQALCAALAATVGTGNIAGVAAAIMLAIETINDAIKESIEEGKFSTCGKLSCIYGQKEVDALLKYFQDLEYTLSITIDFILYKCFEKIVKKII